MQRLIVQRAGPVLLDEVQFSHGDPQKPLTQRHVVIQVKSTPISIYDYWLRMGLEFPKQEKDTEGLLQRITRAFKSLFTYNNHSESWRNHVLGVGGLGKIVEIGDLVDTNEIPLHKDDFVLFISDGNSHASHVSVTPDMLIKLPDSLLNDWSILASLPVDYLAAYQILTRCLQESQTRSACNPANDEISFPGKGLKILIMNGETGLGIALIQLAISMELVVYAAAPITFHAQIRQMGAYPLTSVYKGRRFYYRTSLGGGADIICLSFDPLDSSNGRLFKTLKQFDRVLKPGGTIILSGPMDETLATSIEDNNSSGGHRLGLFSFMFVQKLRNLFGRGGPRHPNHTKLIIYDYLASRTYHRDWFHQDMSALLFLLEQNRINKPKTRVRIPWSEVPKYYAKLDEMGKDSFGGQVLLEPHFEDEKENPGAGGSITGWYDVTSLYESV